MRVFKCPNCGHRMRLSGDRCGRCFAEKPVLMTTAPYKFVVYLLILSAGLFLFVRTLSHFR